MDQQQHIDQILRRVEVNIQDEVGGLLGADFTLVGQAKGIVTKKVVVDRLMGKHICAPLNISGEIFGQGGLLIGIKDGIRLGGTLIMLPRAEMDEAIGREDYSEEMQDSYGEIANIIAGVLQADFGDMYQGGCRFSRGDLEIVVQAKIDIESDQPVPNQSYYQVSWLMALDGHQLGELLLLLPAICLGLLPGAADMPGGKAAAVSERTAVDESSHVSQDSPATAENSAQWAVAERSAGQEKPGAFGGDGNGSGEVQGNVLAADHGVEEVEHPDILLISDDQGEAVKLRQVVEEMGYSLKELSFKDPLNGYLSGELKAIYLVVNEINEQAFGAAIKVSSASVVPLVAVAAGWTRSKVIKAVKYGVRDILLAPASREDIKESLTSNVLHLAA